MQLPPPPPVPPTVTVTAPPVTIPVPIPAFPAQPIQVNKVTDGLDWWTFVFSALGAIGTVGALIVAIVIYKGQLDEAKRAQASQVVLRLNPKVTPPHHAVTKEQIVKALVPSRKVTVINNSGREIHDVILRLDTFDDKGERQVEMEEFATMLAPGREVDRDFFGSVVTYASINFFDATRRNWTLDTYGNMWGGKGLSVDKSEVERRDREFDWSKRVYREKRPPSIER